MANALARARPSAHRTLACLHSTVRSPRILRKCSSELSDFTVLEPSFEIRLL
jgi:hypothetical protein